MNFIEWEALLPTFFVRIRKYVLPITSAKEKHKTWKDTYSDRFLIFAIEPRESMSDRSIFVKTDKEGYVKHILFRISF